MYRDVIPFVGHFVTVTPDSPRAMAAQELGQYLSQFGTTVTVCDTVSDGVRTAISQTPAGGVVLAYGSLYMVGDIRAAAMEE